jgi:arylsulfatase A-like enzyme
MTKPNILIFMTDHQRADTAYPDHPSITPNLDRLVREGVSFTNTYCPSPHCCPARATFFSGLYPSRHGVWNNICNRQALSHGLNSGVRLWSEDLADAGYEQHYSGKWHVSIDEGPGDRGWIEHLVSAGKGTLHGVTWEHYRQIAVEPDATIRGEGEILRPGYGTYRLYGTGERKNDHDQRVVQEGLELIPQLSQSHKPWTLYLGLSGPHDPYVVPQKYLDEVDIDDVPLPSSYEDDLSDKPGVYRKMREMRFGQLSRREVREAIRHFWAYCSYIDDMFGQVMTALEVSGQVENTLVLYTSDHADYVGEHGLFAKGIPCFKGAYHIPAVIRWPAGIKNPGRAVDAFVSEADFAPTLLDVADIQSERYFTGMSLLPFLKEQTPDQWRTAIHTQCNGVELYYTQRSVMTRDYKYVFNGFDSDELYDLRVDPDEMQNLVDNPEYESIKRKLCAQMWRFAYQEDDTAINPYITVSLAPYGPAEAFRR